jgi:hypothetical protein
MNTEVNIDSCKSLCKPADNFLLNNSSKIYLFRISDKLTKKINNIQRR